VLKPSLTCQELVAFLDDYIAGAQEPPVREEFDRHLAECPECVRYLRTYQETVRLTRSGRADEEPVEPPPQALIDAILAGRRKADPGRRS
jgi:anti-sigma factor RsiW